METNSNKKRKQKIELNVEKDTCIKCGKCVRVCPASIFNQASPGTEISLIAIENCISCGHCVAICPTNSVVHSEFPPFKVHSIDKNQMPSSEQVLLLCKARRSNRAFSSKPIPNEALQQILDAAHCAPTASNLQGVEFTLVTDPKVLQQISELTINVFASFVKILSSPLIKPVIKIFSSEIYALLPQFNRLKIEFDNGNDLILRKSTAVLIIHTSEKIRFGCQDANLAYQNASLMAESLGIAQFYTGFVCAAAQQDKKKKLAKLLGIEGKIHAGMALAIPDFRFPNYIDRKEITINRI